ncbi:MAG: squalene synthase HpnD [Francisellaceae bacterium]|nr:squalene synthase HpnD [Francisellaceae bacterium]
MKDYNEYCRYKAVKSGSSFYYSFIFLSPIARQAITALYAFCREVDDIVDECSDKTIALEKINWWQNELENIYLGHPEHPIGFAIKEALAHYSLSKKLFQEILQGMIMDLEYQGYETFEDLKSYCYYVASTVGLLACEIFGYKNNSALEYARILGTAFQLVNIIRDVGEDASRGRIYIPSQELAKFYLKQDDILDRKMSDNFKALMAFQAKRAHEHFKEAFAKLSAEDRYSQGTGLMMANIYQALLQEIEKSDFKVLDQRIQLTPIRKLWIAWRTNLKIKK